MWQMGSSTKSTCVVGVDCIAHKWSLLQARKTKARTTLFEDERKSSVCSPELFSGLSKDATVGDAMDEFKEKCSGAGHTEALCHELMDALFQRVSPSTAFGGVPDELCAEAQELVSAHNQLGKRQLPYRTINRAVRESKDD